MKAISLWQPWATLIVVGAKRVETRSWPPPVSLAGQRIAIHAAGKRGRVVNEACRQEPFAAALGHKDARRLPYRAVVCTAVLARFTRITAEDARRLEERSPNEFAFGDYTPGRFAWVLEDVQRLDPPVPMPGRQRIFDVELHQEALFA